MKVYLADLLTGRRIIPLPHVSAEWEMKLNDTDSLTVKVPVYASSDDTSLQYVSNDARMLDLRNTAAIGKTVMVAEDDGLAVGGVLMRREYDADSGMVTLVASGMWTYFDHRTILPAKAKGKSLIKSDGSPDPQYDTHYRNVTWNTVARNLVEQAMSWPHSNVPVVLEAPETGKSEANYQAVDLNYVGEVLTNITNYQNGCDIGFFPTRTADGLGYEWHMKTGHPLLGGETHYFSASAMQPGIASLSATDDGDKLASLQWFTSGKSDDKTLVVSAYTDILENAGAPIWESVDSSHSTVKRQATLQAYANEAAAVYWQPVSSTEAKVHRGYLHSVNQTLANYTVGDYIRFTTKGDWYYVDGAHTRRITGIKASESSNWITFTLGDVFDGVKVTVDNG